MITGRNDTYLTIAEFAAMVGRSEKTVRNWISEGRLAVVDLCGVPLIALSAVEALITGTAAAPATDGALALRLINRAAPDGTRCLPERHQSRNRKESHDVPNQ